MHSISTYRKLRDDVTLTNIELQNLEELEAQLPAPRRRAGSSNPFLKRCATNAMPPTTLALGQAARQLIEQKVDGCRRDFMAMVAEGVVNSREYVLGRRFYSDNSVFSLVRAAAGVEEFFLDPYGWIMDGLRAAAQLDHRDLFMVQERAA